MKVILKEYVYKHGVAGDIVEVANGYARNYLIPRGLAVKATDDALQLNESLLAEAAIRRQELNDKLIEVSNKIADVELAFGRKAGSNGKLYGSVTPTDITDALLEKTGVDINRRRISEKSLRELGTHNVTIRMGADLSPQVRVTIVREEDLAAYLAQGELPEEDDIDEDAELLDGMDALETTEAIGEDAEAVVEETDVEEAPAE